MQFPPQLLRSRRTPILGILVALAALASLLAWSGLRLRQNVQAQIANRDGEALDAVAVMQYLDDKTSDETLSSLEDPGEQIQLALKISRLRNVIGVRLFSTDGVFVNAFPAYIMESTLAPEDLATLKVLKPVSHFLPKARLAEHDLLAAADEKPAALLEVNIPLRADDGRLAGIAQFLMNGASIAQEYAQLDRHLVLESLLAFVSAGAVLAAGLALAFARLQRANKLLAERTSNLLHANRELALAAKTSAVGALTSHLIHGLRNPLNGLHTFVQDRASEKRNDGSSDWETAVQTTQRMEKMINRIVNVLQEQQTSAEYEITLEELAQIISETLQPAARAARVSLEISANVPRLVRLVEGRTAAPVGEGPDRDLLPAISNREADLVLLILENLVQNALDATPAGKAVHLFMQAADESIIMEVHDEGPGLPPGIRERLFAPCASSTGGSGIGLAISYQLARHLGAMLELMRSSAEGCIFRLTLKRSSKSQHSGPTEAPECEYHSRSES